MVEYSVHLKWSNMEMDSDFNWWIINIRSVEEGNN